MSRLSEDEERLKNLLKAAVVEVFEERKDLLHEAVADALEDVALARAIEEGERTKTVTRADVFSVLDGGR